MRAPRRLIAFAMPLLFLLAACRSGDPGPGTRGEEPEFIPGGTLRLGLLQDVGAEFDPQKAWNSVTWELFRCCLLRTLVSYPGAPTEEGGNRLAPDLATELPEVSDDGLTWTFRIREGVTYAPPFGDTTIVADDFIRALEREADPEASEGGYAFLYSVIEGFDEFSQGEIESISGLRALDDQTLRVTLNEPVGDFGFRMAMPAAAPIPQGAADGHVQGYGRFLVASGPYMFEGSGELDFSAPANEQMPVGGYEPGKSITLVRNPSWTGEQDEIRPAHVERIEVTIGGTAEENALKVDAGELDFQLDGEVPPEQIRKYQADPQLEDQVFSNPSDTVRYLTMNLAQPPFDDIHVRKAVNLAIDKESLRRIRGGPTVGEIAHHIFPESLVDELLADYNPYPSEANAGSQEAARVEMALSKYDRDGDGACDDPVCRDIPTSTDQDDPYPAQAALIQASLETLGITLDVEELERGAMYERVNDPRTHTSFGLAPAWGKHYVDGSTFGEPLFSSSAIGPDECCNYSLLGATAEELAGFGYGGKKVPSVDAAIDECEASPPGDARFRCWAELDRLLMEEVVPWVPYLFDSYVRPVSGRVVNYTFDQFAALPALDQIALAGGGEEG